MKIFTRSIVILAIGSTMAQAEEYHTLTPGSTISVLTTDVISWVGGGGDSNNSPPLYFQMNDDIWRNGYLTSATPSQVITGAKSIKCPASSTNWWITLKITHTEELSKVGPTSVLVIPENSTGNYDVVVESSGDMTTWSPFVSQTVQSDTAKNFFRVRIVKK